MSARWEWTPGDVPPGVGPWPRTLRAVWAPLLSLAPADERHPLKLGNIGYLLDRLATAQPPRSTRSFPIASYLSPPGMRRWIALRAGQAEIGFRSLPRSPSLGPEWEVLLDHVARFRKLSAGTKAWVISALSQMTLYEDCLRLAQGQAFDLDRTHDAAGAKPRDDGELNDRDTGADRQLENSLD